MESLFEFLLRASAGITLLYIVYWLFLRNETFYHANRWFLILALLSAVLLPLFPLHYSVLIESEKNTTIFQALNDTFKNIKPIQPEFSDSSENIGWKNIILTIYITGTAIFLIRLLTQTIILIHLTIKYRIKTFDGIRIVENEKYGLPFSFFNIVFINPKFHTQENLPEILAHEKVHIREFHWFDLLFIELLTVIFWFNPFIWFFERSIKQNHEYLADKGVLAQGHSAGRYQALLINQLMGMQIIGITNNLNFALNTNRFKMMTKKEMSASRRIKFAWALPAIALLLFAFAEPAYKVKKTKTENLISTVQKGEKEFVIKGKVTEEKNGEPLPGASVIIKGTSIGTVSDVNGQFTLTDPNPRVDQKDGALSSELIVSFVGYESAVGMIKASGNAMENGNYTFKLKEGVIDISKWKISKSKAPLQPSAKNEKMPPPPPPPPVPSKEGNKEVFVIVEELPAYPGGFDGLIQYVTEMQQKLAQAKGLKGKAKVGFTVNAKGKVSDIKIVEKDNDGAGNGAYEIAKEMQDWSPGKQHGKSVPVKYLMPVEF